MSSPLSFVEADFEDIFFSQVRLVVLTWCLGQWILFFFSDFGRAPGSGTPLTVNYSGLEIGGLGNWDPELRWWWRDVDVVVVGGGSSGGGGGGLVVGRWFVLVVAGWWREPF